MANIFRDVIRFAGLHCHCALRATVIRPRRSDAASDPDDRSR
jgi:hypothetical protein